jgi:hypothetical protein
MHYGNDEIVENNSNGSNALSRKRRLLLHETPDMVKNALRQFQAAVDVLPLSSRQAYAEAAIRCPHLVASETNPIIWLRYEQFNVWEAAQRFVQYWEFRKKFFGNRAFYPLLNFTASETAFTSDDFSNLATGCIVLLPSSANDCTNHIETAQSPSYMEKRHVLFTDRTRLNGKVLEIEACLRLIFYFYSYVINIEMMAPVLNRIVVVDLMQFIPRQKLGLIALEMGRKSMPAILDPIIVAVPYTMKRSFAQEMLPAIMQRLGNYFAKDRFIIEVGSSKLDIQQKLETHNLIRSCLPQSVGGSWTYDKFNTWYKQKRCTEVTGTVFENSVLPTDNSSDVQSYIADTFPKPSKRARNRVNDDCFKPEVISKLIANESKDVSLTLDDENLLIEQLRRTNDALKCIPWSERGALAEGADRSPYVVMIEANAMLFIKYGDSEIQAAVRQLASYWRKRKELLGEHAFVSIKDWKQNEFGTFKSNFVLRIN